MHTNTLLRLYGRHIFSLAAASAMNAGTPPINPTPNNAIPPLFKKPRLETTMIVSFISLPLLIPRRPDGDAHRLRTVLQVNLHPRNLPLRQRQPKIHPVQQTAGVD